MSPEEIGRKLKEKYPQYAGKSDIELGMAYLEKYGSKKDVSASLGITVGDSGPIPSKFQPQPIPQPTPTTPQPQQPTKQVAATKEQTPKEKEELVKLLTKQPGFFESLIGALARPFIETGKRVGEAGFQTALTALPGGPQDIGSAEQQARLKRPSLFMNEEELQRASNVGTAALDTAKSTAGLASFAVPVGRATSVLGKTVPGLSKGFGGVGIGTLFEAGQPGATPGSIATSGVLGGIAGRLLPGILGGGKGLQQTGQALKRGIINPKVGSGAGALTREIGLADELTKLGVVKKTAGGTRQAIADFYGVTKKEIGAILDASDKGQGINRVINSVKTFITTEGSYFVPKDKAYNNLLTRELSLITKAAGPTKRLTSKVIREQIARLDNQLSNAFKKESGQSAAAITNVEGVRLDVRRGLDKVFKILEPEIGEISARQSILQKASPGLKEAALKSESFRPLGVPTGINLNAPLQGLRSLTAGGVQTAGRAQEAFNIGAPSLQAALGAKLPSALQQRQRQEQQLPAISPQSSVVPQTKADLLNKYGLTSPGTSSAVDQWPQGFATPEQFSAAQFEPSLTEEQRDRIKESYEAGLKIQKESAKKGTGQEFLDKALENIDFLAGLDTKSLGPLAGIPASLSLSFLGGVGVSGGTVELNTRWSLLKLNILRAYQGARISDADYRLADAYVGSIISTPSTATANLKALREVLSNAQPPAPSQLTPDQAGYVTPFSSSPSSPAGP